MTKHNTKALDLTGELSRPEQRGDARRIGVHPRQVTARLTAKICERIMAGQSLHKICNRGNPRMPTLRTVASWLANDPDFREAYYQACRIAAQLRIDQVFDIADDATNDFMEVEVPLRNGESTTKIVVNTEAIQRSKLRVDTRKWYAQKMIPKLYGDKTTQEHTVSGDLAKLLGAVTNKDKGLPNGS